MLRGLLYHPVSGDEGVDQGHRVEWGEGDRFSNSGLWPGG